MEEQVNGSLQLVVRPVENRTAAAGTEGYAGQSDGAGDESVTWMQQVGSSSPKQGTTEQVHF